MRLAGWRALSGLVLLAVAGFGATSAGAEPRFVCRGNEPFWRLDIDGAEAVLRWPGEEGIAHRQYCGTAHPFTFLDPPWHLWRGRAEDGELVIVLRAETCLDTMADEPPFAYRALISFAAGGAATGCCDTDGAGGRTAAPPAQFAAKTADDWSRLWPELAPAIAACLDHIGGREVLTAWPMNRRRVGVLLATGDGGRVTCQVIAGPWTVERIDAVAADAPPMPGEGRPRFVPGAGRPPAGCASAERIEAAPGHRGGHLCYPSACP